nr:hypothetical protein [Tanacetum cinerariifolium]
MNNKKHIVSLESFMEMLHICPRIHGQSFDELPFEEEILNFIRFFGHSATIRTLTDININKLYQPWRSFATIINKCLTGKSSGYDSFRLSQAQILWGLYHKRNIDYAFLIWEDFMYQVEHKNHKKSNEMYYPRFTKVIIHYFMSKDPSILRRNKINWHYVRDDFIFSMIKVVSRHQNTQQYDAMLPIELTNDEIRNTKAYKEYYAFATGEATPKPKASARRKRSGSDTSITPPSATTTPKPTVVVTPKLIAAVKGKQPAKSLSAPSENSSDDEGADDQEKVDDDDDEDQEVAKNDDQDDAEESKDDDKVSESDKEVGNEETRVDESFDPIPCTLESSEDEGDGKENQGLNVNEEENVDEEEHAEEEEEDELHRDVNINPERGLQVNQEVKDSHVILTPVHPNGQQESSSVSSQFVTNILNPTSDAGMESIFATASISVAPLPITTPTMTPSTVTTITTTGQAPIPPTPIPSETDRLRDVYQRENDEFLRTIDENMKRIIKEQVKGQVKEQVSRILPRIEQYVNAQLEAEVITRSSHSSRTSYAVSADLSKIELKKILIEKMEGNKETVILKRRRDDDDDQDEGPSARSDRGSKRRREGKEPESASALLETATRSAGRSTTRSKSRQASASESAFAEEPVQTTSQMDEPSYPVFETEVYKATTNQLDWVNPKGQQYPHNLLQPLPLIPDNRGRRVILFAHFINNDLEYLRGGASSRKYTTSVTKTKAGDYGKIKWIKDLFYGFAVNRESARDVYSKRKIIDVTDLNIMKWHSCKHLDWITVRRDDDKLYNFKEGDFKRLCLQDIEDMLLLLVQGKLNNLTIEERFAFNVSLKMFTRIIVIQRRVEDLQLGVESYQKRLNLTKPDMYWSDLKRREAYTAYSNPRGFIYQNKDKKNRLIRIDELYKFSDGTLNDVRTALDDHLKGIRMQYLPQKTWRKGDKDRAAAMIQAIDKMLKTRRIMRSLEKFVGGRLFTLIVLSALRRFDNENTVSLINLILRSILTDLQETLKRKWRYLIPADSQSHNHMLIPDYQDIIFQDFRYFDEFECY